MKPNILDLNSDDLSRLKRINDIFGNDIYEFSGWRRMSESDDINYLNFMFNCFSMIKNKTILEIGSGFGWHTKTMLKFDPKKIICIEPDKRLQEEEVYITNKKIVTVYNCTANDYYAHYNNSVDIVLCCNVLYHLHSPIHLLEKIINISKPKYLLIETVDGNGMSFGSEQFGGCGNAHQDAGVEFPILKALYLPANTIIEFVETTNYRVEKMHKSMGYHSNNPSPSLVCTILFKNINGD
jgi:SAM-dependent methyltransferase